MSDYDNRQYRLMLDQLQNFESKQIDLRHLISGLESLLGCLEQPTSEWQDAFRREWNALEEVYAVAVDRKYAELPEAHKQLVAESVLKLNAMVNSKVSVNRSTTG